MISVVLPVYNGASYLHDCIRSIIVQTERNFELVISDDNSTDNSKQIIETYKDNRIKFITNKDERGIFQNLNNAIRNSNGKYIQIFNQDDVMEPEMLACQVASLQRYPGTGMVFCRKQAIDGNGTVIADRNERNYPIPAIIPSENAYQYFTAFGCLPGNLSPVMITRAAWEQTGPFNPDFHYAGDFEYWVRLSAGWDICYNKPVLCNVRAHQKRASKVLGTKDLKLTQQLFKLNNQLVNQYPAGALQEHAISYVQRTVGIYNLHILVKFILKRKWREAKTALPVFTGIFGLPKLWFKYVRYRISKQRAADYPIYPKH